MLGRLELILLAAIAATVFIVVRLYRRRGRLSPAFDHDPDPAAPRCGRCRYIVRGVPSFTCPECGSDLREVGILTPALRTNAGPLPWLIAWSLALFLVAIPLTDVLAHLLPLWRQYHMQRVIFIQDGNFNATIRATAIGHVFGRQHGYQAAGPAPETLTLSDDQKRTGNDLVVEFPSGAHRFTNLAGQRVDRPSGFGPAAIAEWLDAHGASTGAVTAEQVRARAADVDAAAREIPTAQGKFTKLGQSAGNLLPPVTAHPAIIYARPVAWNWALLYFAWFVLWWFGVTRILKRHRSNLAARAPAAGNSAGDPAPPVLR